MINEEMLTITPEQKFDLEAMMRSQAQAEAQYLDMVEQYRRWNQCEPYNGLHPILIIIITIIVIKLIDYLNKDKYEKYPKTNTQIKNNQEEASVTADEDTHIAQK